MQRLGMGQIPYTMMLRAVQEIYHSSFRIPLSLRLRGIRKLVVVYFLYRTQHHCISYIVPYLCAIAQSNHLIYHGINLVSHGKKTRIPRLQQRRMSLHCFVLKTNYYIVPKQLFGKKWVKKGLRLFLRKKLLRLTRCLRSTIVT